VGSAHPTYQMSPFLRNLHRTTFAQALAGAVLLWAALPPVDFGPLAFVAPVAWILLIRRETLPGRRPYWALYLVGFLFWMAALHWLRLPHPATGIGWVALSAYFAGYLPLFVGLSRTAVHRLRIPVILAAPIVWTGLELVRAYLFTGMSMAALGHTQYRWIALVQLSDLFGARGVSFLVMLVAACLGRVLPVDDTRRVFWPLLPAGAAMAAALVYGHVRTSVETPEPVLRAALIQGSIDTVLDPEPEVYEEVWKHYTKLSWQAKKEYGEFDVLVWPETTFPDTLITFAPDATIPNGYPGSDAEFRAYLPERAAGTLGIMGSMARSLEASLILGIPTHHFGRDDMRRFNSVVFVDQQGRLVDRYDKTHLVLFGEYVPFARWLPWIGTLTPLPVSLNPGKGPVAFEVEGVRLAPNVCYESVLSRVLRRQVNGLAAEGREPDVLVNVTNDGWFWGSSELDMHLICSVFRAVECRKPILIAANTGFSAHIDGSGRILKRGPRRAPDTLLAEVSLDHRRSPYLRYGDWLSGLCLLGCLLAVVVGLRQRWFSKPLGGSPPAGTDTPSETP